MSRGTRRAHRNALTARDARGGPAPASVPLSRLGAVGEALSGIAAELDAELTWDFRERTAEERAADERRPWYPSRVVTDPAEFAEHDLIKVTRTGEVMRVRSVS